MLYNFKEKFEQSKALVKDIEINEFLNNIMQLLKASDIFKVDADCEYNIDLLCVQAMEDLAKYLYNVNDTVNSIFQLTRSDYCRLKAIKYIIENIDEFWNYIYGLNKEVKNLLTKPSKYYAYHGNIKEDIYELARNLYSECSLGFSNDEAVKFVNGTLSDLQILNIKKNTLKFLKLNFPIRRKEIIDNKVKIIINSAKFLDKYGFMDYYINANNTRAKRLNIPYLQTNTRTGKKEKPFTCVSDYYDSNILSLLPDEELSALSLFMVNRVEKVKSKIVKTLCMITFLSNETKNNIDDERWINIKKIPNDEIVEAITRYNMLTNHLADQRRVIYSRYNPNTQYTANTNLSYRELNLFEGISKEFSDAYNGEFNRFEEDDMLEEDLSRLITADNLQIFYEYKDDLIDILLTSIISSNININWGIVEGETGGFVDSNDQILLAFDFPGYNAPISCHADLNNVISILANLTNDTIIPMYLGDDQLVYESNFNMTHYSTLIPFKLSKEQKDALKEANKTSTNGIINHIAMMQNVLSTAKLKKEANKFIDLLSFTEELKVNPTVKSYK